MPENSLLENHTEIGDELLPWAVGLLVVAAVGWFAYWRFGASATEGGLRRVTRRGLSPLR